MRIRRVKIRITRSIIPNLLTLGNLFSGFIAIIYIAKYEYEIAAIMILIAGFFDVLDGVVARLIRATSAIGVELDSLCDAVSFGVAPSFMLYTMFFYQFDPFGILLASLPALSGVYRLARFNVLASYDDKLYFKGMPIPASALFISSFAVFQFQDPSLDTTLKNIMMFSVPLIASLSMISTVKFDNFPRPSWNAIKTHPWNFGITLLGIIISTITRGYFIFYFMLFYILISYIRFFFTSTKKGINSKKKIIIKKRT